MTDYIKFNSEEERLQHPEAKRIPSRLWEAFFCNNCLTDQEIRMMVSPIEDIVLLLQSQHFKQSTRLIKKRCISLLLINEALVDSESMLQIAEQVPAIALDLWRGSIFMGSVELFNELFKAKALGFLSIDKINQEIIKPQLRIAIAQNHLAIASMLFDKIDDKKTLIQSDLVRFFKLACKAPTSDVMDFVHQIAKPIIGEASLCSILYVDDSDALPFALTNAPTYIIDYVITYLLNYMKTIEVKGIPLNEETKKLLSAHDYLLFKYVAKNHQLNRFNDLISLAHPQENSAFFDKKSAKLGIPSEIIGDLLKIIFFEAIKQEHIVLLKKLAPLYPKKLASIVAADEYLAYHTALEKGDLKTVEFLISANLINVKNSLFHEKILQKGELTSLYRALEQGHIKLTKIVLTFVNETLFYWGAKQRNRADDRAKNKKLLETIFFNDEHSLLINAAEKNDLLLLKKVIRLAGIYQEGEQKRMMNEFVKIYGNLDNIFSKLNPRSRTDWIAKRKKQSNATDPISNIKDIMSALKMSIDKLLNHNNEHLTLSDALLGKAISANQAYEDIEKQYLVLIKDYDESILTQQSTEFKALNIKGCKAFIYASDNNHPKNLDFMLERLCSILENPAKKLFDSYEPHELQSIVENLSVLPDSDNRDRVLSKIKDIIQELNPDVGQYCLN